MNTNYSATLYHFQQKLDKRPINYGPLKPPLRKKEPIFTGDQFVKTKKEQT